MASRPALLVVAGPNGSGKTTLAAELRARAWFTDFLYINADMIAQTEFGGWNAPGASEKAAVRAALLLRSALNAGRNTVIETVFASGGPSLLRRAKQAGFLTRLYFVGTTDPAINVARVAARVERGGHAAPIDQIIRRYHAAMAELPIALSIADRGRLYDNSAEDAPMRRLLRTRDGAIERQFVDPLPAWADVQLPPAPSRDDQNPEM